MKKILFLLISINLFSKDIILLLGGINRANATYMNKIKDALSQEGREIIDDIDVETFSHSITQQADAVYDDLINKKGITAQDRIVIIGHSQGGLRGYELYKQHGDKLTILALFTISTPWRGAKALENLYSIKSCLNCIKYKLDTYKELKDTIVSYTPSIKIEDIDKYLSYIPDIENFLETLQKAVGVQEMRPDSTFIKSLNNLHNDKDLNIFNIIRDQGDIFNFIDFTESEIDEAVNKLTWTKETTDTTFKAAFVTGLVGFFTFNPWLAAGGWVLSMGSTVTMGVSEHWQIRHLKDIGDSIDRLKNYIKNLNGYGKKGDVILSIYEQIHDCLNVEKEYESPFKETNRAIQNFMLRAREITKTIQNPQSSIAEHKENEESKMPIELIYIKDTIHDFIDFENFKELKEFIKPDTENKVIYNHPETLEFIKNKVEKIFSEY